MRYCDIEDTHLPKVSFCNHRRDFLACSCSPERHGNQPFHSLARSLVCNRVHGDREVAHCEQVGSFSS